MFFTGKKLDQDAKDELLKYFPNDGLLISPIVQFDLLKMSFGRWAFSIGPEIITNTRVPKSLFHFILNGNKFDQTIDLSGIDAEVQAVNKIAVSHGREIVVPQLTNFVEKFTVGGTVKLLTGLAYSDVVEMDANLTFDSLGVVLNGDSKTNVGVGGFGFAMDIGAAAIINNRLSANFAINNLFGNINWGSFGIGIFEDGDALVMENKYSSRIESKDFMGDDLDSLFNAGTTLDTSYTPSELKSKYPTSVLIGVQYNALHNLRVFANFRQFLSNDLIFNYTPQLSVATEYNPAPWCPLRFGMSIGGFDKFKWAIGTGLNFKHYTLDFGFSQIGGMFKKSKGFALSFEQSLVF